MTSIQNADKRTIGICEERISIEDLNLELNGISTDSKDLVLYYDHEQRLGFEAEFDKGVFNGRVTFSENIGLDDEEWNVVTDPEIYEHIKTIAINDYKQK